jgi:SAM-dependent methyltransferase
MADSAGHSQHDGLVRPRQAEDFDASYAATPPWDIGRPQPALSALADSGAIRGRVLDVGCGTGEHALMASALGLAAVGVDGSATAIAKAEVKARDRDLGPRFMVGDVLDLASMGPELEQLLGEQLGPRAGQLLGEQPGPRASQLLGPRAGQRLGLFDTVIDCGVFHVFDDSDRRRYVDSLAAVIPPGGRYFMLCFSEHQPGDWGPRRITQDEIRASFAGGWRVDSIEPARLVVTILPDGVNAWLSALTRT